MSTRCPTCWHPSPCCPVCRRPVFATGRGNVTRHRDKANNNCPMSGQSFTLVNQTESDIA